MKGLIYRELITMKKTLIICAVIYVVAMIGVAVIFPAFEIGNLADMPEDGKNSTFEMVRMYSTIILCAVAVAGPAIGHNEQIPADIKTGWMKYSYTMPVTAETVAKSKMIVRMGLVYIGAVFAVLGEVYVGAVSGTGVRKGMLVLIMALMLMQQATALEIPAMIHFKDQKKIAAGGIVLGMAFTVPALLVIRNITNEIGARVNELTEAAKAANPDAEVVEIDANIMDIVLEIAQPYLDVFGKCVMIAFVPLAAILIVGGYKWTVKELKRRSL